MPAFAETNNTMQELTGVKFNSGEQNKDIIREDRPEIWTTKWSPTTLSIDTNDKQRNITNGVNTDGNVNADTAKSVGRRCYRQ